MEERLAKMFMWKRVHCYANHNGTGFCEECEEYLADRIAEYISSERAGLLKHIEERVRNLEAKADAKKGEFEIIAVLGAMRYVAGEVRAFINKKGKSE